MGTEAPSLVKYRLQKRPREEINTSLQGTFKPPLNNVHKALRTRGVPPKC